MSDIEPSSASGARGRFEAVIVPGLPVDVIWAASGAAPGNEIESGKFFSEESSSALVANAFGPFLHRPGDLPRLPGTENHRWPASRLRPEFVLRFP